MLGRGLRTKAWLQWGPTRGPGWSTSIRLTEARTLPLQWGPTRGPGWSWAATSTGGPPDCFSGARPEGRDGRIGVDDLKGKRPIASVGPDPRAGMVAGRGGPVVGAHQASVGPDPRAGMVVLTGSCGRWPPNTLQWGPTRGPGWSGGPPRSTSRRSTRFSGARPEGRDGRGGQGASEYRLMLLQWGPTRGPGWSPGLTQEQHLLRLASVGPDPRAGMVVRHRGPPHLASVASVGPDPRAGMVASEASLCSSGVR